jgi:hypothetical protein
MVITAELGRFETHETGTTTGLDHESGTMSEFGTKTNELVGTVLTCDDGIETTKLDGTLSGTADHETIATEGDEAGTMTSVAGNEETHDNGKATGDDQVDGTEIESGAATNELTGTATIAVLGTDWINDFGTDPGTYDHETMTAFGDEAIVITTELGRFETHETGTTTGLDQVVGTTTVAGT